MKETNTQHLDEMVLNYEPLGDNFPSPVIDPNPENLHFVIQNMLKGREESGKSIKKWDNGTITFYLEEEILRRRLENLKTKPEGPRKDWIDLKEIPNPKGMIYILCQKGTYSESDLLVIETNRSDLKKDASGNVHQKSIVRPGYSLPALYYFLSDLPIH